jgi:DNA repair exonuclease SbcCD nuclease subunit
MGYKIALISDVHFGCRNNSETYLEIIKKLFTDTLVQVLDAKNITDVRILGDLFDCRNNINVRTLNVAMEVFKWFKTNKPNIKFKILLGNHDIYYKNRIDVNSIECLRQIGNVEIIDRVVTETINGKSIISYPWLIPGSNEHSHFISVANGDKEYDLCFGHFEVRGFEISKGVYDTENLEVSLFKKFKRVFTGHYHIRNTIENVTYLGCPFQQTWGDYGDDKGINIWDVDTETHEFVKNESSPEFIKIFIDDLQNKNVALLKKVKGNHVKFMIDKKVDESWIIKARAKLESFEPLTFEVENTIIETQIDDSDIDISKINDPFSLLMECVENIFELEKDIDKTELKRYLMEIYSESLKEGD